MAATLRHRGPDAMGLSRSVPSEWRIRDFPLSTYKAPDSRWSARTGTASRIQRRNSELSGAGSELSYPFQTQGDTEVLFALYEKYGPEGANRLRGQFAYAIYDTETGETH